MDALIYTAMSGAERAMRGQQVHANNLANLDTNGFRANLELAQAAKLPGYGYDDRHMSQLQSNAVTDRQGTLRATGRDLDIAISGPGYFAVQGPTGAYDLRSEKRWHPSAQSQTTEAGIHVTPLGNLYVSIGEESPQGVMVRLWNHPLIVWIWIGGFVMAAGGAVSLSDRRLRVGALVKTPAPQPQPVPAE